MKNIFALIIYLLSCNAYADEVKNIKALDKSAAFNFIIMSDNKGDSPYSKKEFARMVRWSTKSKAHFAIGLGDHLKRGWKNDFLTFLANNEWWRDNFYPNIADGENEYYGSGQDDWGAGGAFLNELDMHRRLNVTVRKNGAEYYAKFRVKGYTVHLIQLHYSDSPDKAETVFNEDTRSYLIETLDNIKKRNRDIIIVAAHSRNGFWVDMLSPERQKKVMEKCDLVLSATTHYFERKVVKGYEEGGALVINTGSITYPNSCPGGYVQVHVLEEPRRLSVQYINAERRKRELQHDRFAIVKELGGKISSPHYREPRPEEDPDFVMGKLDRDYSSAELMEIMRGLYMEASGAHSAELWFEKGLNKGEVTRQMLRDVFPFDNQIWAVPFDREQYKEKWKKKIPEGAGDTVMVAMSNYWAGGCIADYAIPDDKVVKSGKTELGLLIKWLKTRKGEMSKDDWKLVWSDEFDYEGHPDPEKWSQEEGYLRNDELQYYTKDRLENARVEDGCLVIETRKDNFEGHKYTSASVTTRDRQRWLYCRIEVKAKIPTGKGMWPAIWTLGDVPGVGWPKCGELDIMENVGYDPDNLYCTVHTEAYNHTKKTQKGGVLNIKDPFKDFYVYAVEWSKDRIDFFIDGKKIMTHTDEGLGEDAWPFFRPLYLLILSAYGGGWGGVEGVDDSILPQKFYVDYVRVYQK